MKKLFLLSQLLVLTLISKAQYVQTFETTTLATLVQDSGWVSSGVTISNSGKLVGSKELKTQILNTATSSSTFLITYLYQGIGLNQIDFQHVIDNASGKDITLTITVLDINNNPIQNVTPFSYSYVNANAVTSSYSFYTTDNYKLRFDWSGAKVKSGSAAFLDMVAVTSSFIPLPVKLVSFTSEKQEQGVSINWTSAEETNFSHYELYKSTDGLEFTKLAEITANNYNTQLNSYTYTDLQKSPIAFYKIKFVDQNNAFSWSNVLRVTGSSMALASKIYPVPATNNLFFEFNSEDLSNANIVVTDMMGNIAMTQSLDVIASGSVINLDLSTIASGIYYIQIAGTEKAEKAIKFTKL